MHVKVWETLLLEYYRENKELHLNQLVSIFWIKGIWLTVASKWQGPKRYPNDSKQQEPWIYWASTRELPLLSIVGKGEWVTIKHRYRKEGRSWGSGESVFWSGWDSVRPWEEKLFWATGVWTEGVSMHKHRGMELKMVLKGYQPLSYYQQLSVLN